MDKPKGVTSKLDLSEHLKTMVNDFYLINLQLRTCQVINSSYDCLCVFDQCHLTDRVPLRNMLQNVLYNECYNRIYHREG